MDVYDFIFIQAILVLPLFFWASCPCCEIINPNTVWAGNFAAGTADNKLYLQSGEFTSTLKTSLNLTLLTTGVGGAIRGVSWDGTDTFWGRIDSTPNIKKLMLQSGQFSSTIKTSQDISDRLIRGIAWDGDDTLWCYIDTDQDFDIMLLQSGKFSSTIKGSQDVSGIGGITAISYDGDDVLWCGGSASGARLWLQSGQFTLTVKTSQDVSPPLANVRGISWNGADTLYCGRTPIPAETNKLLIQSGKFSSTVKTSLDVGQNGLLINFQVFGINANKLTIG